ncbi:plasmid recombination protein [Billgrantia desiderata]|uniref:plasmid recombination protein n=1 Tax=Billgrantia desiderata TaxID=52021 RepID=UPI003F40E16A
MATRERPEVLATAIRERLSLVTKRTARDAVLCLEYLVTARREAFTEYGGATNAVAYFRDSLSFLERRHGAANVVAVNIQRDERAPHLVAYVVPLVERPARTVRRSVFVPGRDEEGRQRREVREFPAPPEVALSAWHFYGEPEQLAALQTAFAEEVGERHGLARGLEFSAATHTTNTAHHAAIARAMADHIELPPEALARPWRLTGRESPEEAARRVSVMIRDHYASTVASAATATHDRRRAREMVETARRHRARYRAERDAHTVTRAQLERLTGGLDPEQRQALERQSAGYRQANRRALLEQHRREETEKRQGAERQALEHRQHEAKVAARQAESAREDLEAARLRGITPVVFAMLPDTRRLLCWQLLRERDDLTADFERVMASGLVDTFGHLTTEGRALLAVVGQGGTPADPAPRQAERSRNTRAVEDLDLDSLPPAGPTR